jgi:hypothetical protein
LTTSRTAGRCFGGFGFAVEIRQVADYFIEIPRRDRGLFVRAEQSQDFAFDFER